METGWLKKCILLLVYILPDGWSGCVYILSASFWITIISKYYFDFKLRHSLRLWHLFEIIHTDEIQTKSTDNTIYFLMLYNFTVVTCKYFLSKYTLELNKKVFKQTWSYESLRSHYNSESYLKLKVTESWCRRLAAGKYSIIIYWNN